jgi:RHS repeat-associated protein
LGASGSTDVYRGIPIGYDKKFHYDQSGRLIAENSVNRYYNEMDETDHIVYLYDESGIIGMEYTATSGATNTYYFQRNLQGDVVAIYNTSGTKVGGYAYDAWGNCTITLDTNGIASRNPIRYRGYYYDSETGFYYLNARYYSPELRRFISPDDTAYLDPESVNGLNLYCYCNNDPVNFVDPSGHWIQTVFDLFSFGASVVEVVIKPGDPLAWAGLIGDAVDLLPFVTGVGEGVRATKMVKYADDVIDSSYDTIKFVKATDYKDAFEDGGKMLHRVGNSTDYRHFTVSNHVDGTKLHTLFMDNGDVIWGTKLRYDGLDPVTNTLFELKPFNKRNVRKGVKQIIQYNNAMGGGYKMIIVLY